MSKEPNRWEGIHQAKEVAETSWFENRPQVLLNLIAATGIGTDAAIVDVGAGDSRLVDCLLEQGFHRITVLDLSETALAKARMRLPETAPVDCVVGNVLHWRPSRRFDVWHDRAAFHFLTETADQEAYLQVMDRALLSGGYAIIGTFAIDGPDMCSGLPVARYDPALLSARLGKSYLLVRSLTHDHRTPWGSVQRFHFWTVPQGGILGQGLPGQKPHLNHETEPDHGWHVVFLKPKTGP